MEIRGPFLDAPAQHRVYFSHAGFLTSDIKGFPSWKKVGVMPRPTRSGCKTPSCGVVTVGALREAPGFRVVPEPPLRSPITAACVIAVLQPLAGRAYPSPLTPLAISFLGRESGLECMSRIIRNSSQISTNASTRSGSNCFALPSSMTRHASS